MKKNNASAIFLIAIILFYSCNKYLDKKPDKKLVVPSTIQDIQALLDQNSLMNESGSLTGEASADNYYLPEGTYDALSSEQDKELYTWGRDIMRAQSSAWSDLYDIVYDANVALETLGKIPRNASNQNDWDNVKGSALFYRSYSFQQVLFTWSLAYDSLTADKDLGIPLRLTSDFNESSVRATVRQSYEQCINDLKTAAALLPSTPSFVTRPSRAAAYGLLARILLSMRKYNEAGSYADSCINLSQGLLDYNTLDASRTYPVPAFNKEIIFYDAAITPGPLVSSKAKIDTALYAAYRQGDLRKLLFFKANKDSTIAFRGSYKGNSGYFTGLASDEIYLIRSECYAREGRKDQAISDLNILLSNRYDPDTFVPFSAATAQQAIDTILAERRKELIFRDLRWMDIKRLNKEGDQLSLQRIIGGTRYSLVAGSNGFALPLPVDVVALSGMQQNPQ